MSAQDVKAIKPQHIQKIPSQLSLSSLHLIILFTHGSGLYSPKNFTQKKNFISRGMAWKILKYLQAFSFDSLQARILQNIYSSSTAAWNFSRFCFKTFLTLLKNKVYN
jgi:hypothetical protein